MGRLYPKSTENSSGVGMVKALESGGWPYAVEITEIAEAGVNVPNCYDDYGDSFGSFIAQDPGRDCSCNSNFRFGIL